MGNCWSSPPAAVAAAAVTASDSSTTAAAAADSSATAAAAADSSTAPTKPNSGSNFSGTSNTGSNDGKGLSGMSSSTGNSLFSAGAAIGSLYGRSGEILAAANLKTYSFRELEEVTMNFSKETILGTGGFGSVYVGWVDEETLATTKIGTGMNVAIKRLNHSTSGQGLQEWRSEVHFLGRISHPNLVKLLGYCLEDQELLLVYEFMPKGSLDRHLFNRNSASEPLSWERRMKIAMDAARGLAFLHTSEKVIYRDFKAANILLDDNYNAKISDFGLARLGPAGEDSFVSTRIMGTRGYVAPEYMKTGHLYVKSDVYGFGAVLLELLTGLRAVDDKRPSGQQKLMDVVASHRANLKCIMDERMEGKYSSKAALIVARLALRCLDSNHKSRPSMKEVLETLENCSR